MHHQTITDRADTRKNLKTKDMETLTYFKQLKQQNPDAVILFRMGNFYQTFEEDAEKASNDLGITLTKRNDGVRMAGFPFHALDTYLPRLIRCGNRVAIVDKQ